MKMREPMTEVRAHLIGHLVSTSTLGDAARVLGYASGESLYMTIKRGPVLNRIVNEYLVGMGRPTIRYEKHAPAKKVAPGIDWQTVNAALADLRRIRRSM